ncbi:hypothetical protein fh0823_14210 [Francisella halioticida]|nr:hypothetical protein fh0823_14210 [Francisella halioticida]
MQFAFLNSNRYATINAFKASIAVMLGCSVGCVLGNILDIQRMYLWIVITILVVMSTQPNLGGALDKAVMRFLGTLIGATVAIVIVTSVDNNTTQVLLMLPFIFLAVYFAGASRYSYAGTLAGITLIIIILIHNLA